VYLNIVHIKIRLWLKENIFIILTQTILYILFSAIFKMAAADDLPRVIKFAYENFSTQIAKGSTKAKCKFCNEKKKNTEINEKTGVTSNYVKHLQRVHQDK
jgi:hypothetical protein